MFVNSKIYSFYLFVNMFHFLLISLHLFVDHNLFILNYATILPP